MIRMGNVKHEIVPTPVSDTNYSFRKYSAVKIKINSLKLFILVVTKPLITYIHGPINDKTFIQ